MPGSPGATSAIRRETWVEIAGYVGVAAAVVGTVIAFVSRTDLSDAASLAITLVVTAVLVAAGFAIGDRPPDAYQRMRSILWFAAVESFGLASGIFWLKILDFGGKSGAEVSLGVTAVFGLMLWLLLRRSLQQIAFYLTVVGTITTLTFPRSLGASSAVNDPLLVAWVCGVVWFIVGTAEIVRPHRTARVLGAVVALLSSLELFRTSFSLALTLMSVTSLVLLGVGDRKDDRAVGGLGIVGILVASAVEVAHVVGSSRGAAVAAIAIGFALLVLAIAVVRMSAPEDVPPVPSVLPDIPPPPAVDYDR